MFKKDFTLFGPRQKPKTIPVPPPQQQIPSTILSPSPFPPPQTPREPPRRETTHHSTLLLLEKNGLAQTPRAQWAGQNVEETPRSRNPKSITGRAVFDPASPARQADVQLRRYLRQRQVEREARSREPGWMSGPALMMTKVLEDIEDVRNELRDAARWENELLEVKERRKANNRASWFGGEPEEERRVRLEAEASVKGVSALEWTREFEDQPLPQIVELDTKSSSASIKSARRTSSWFTSVSSPVESTRNSILSTTTRSTPRSSIMSITQPSTVSSPVSSGMPSPTLSTSSKGSFWKGQGPSEKLPQLTLPPSVVAPTES